MTEADGRRRTSQIGQLLSNQIESAQTIRIRTQYETIEEFNVDSKAEY